MASIIKNSFVLCVLSCFVAAHAGEHTELQRYGGMSDSDGGYPVAIEKYLSNKNHNFHQNLVSGYNKDELTVTQVLMTQKAERMARVAEMIKTQGVLSVQQSKCKGHRICPSSIGKQIDNKTTEKPREIVKDADDQLDYEALSKVIATVNAGIHIAQKERERRQKALEQKAKV